MGKKLWSLFFVLILLVGGLGYMYYFNLLNLNSLSLLIPTGRVVSELSTSYVVGENLSGNLAFSMKAGELVPKDSVVVVTLNGSNYEYDLSDLVSDSAVVGDYYAEDVTLSGSGEGYGTPGQIGIPVPVGFVFRVFTEGNSGISGVGNNGNGGNNGNNGEDEETTEETVEEETDSDNVNDSNETSSEEETTEEDTSNDNGEETSEENDGVVLEVLEEETTDTSNDGEETTEETVEEETTEEDTSNDDGEETSEESEEVELSPITGNAVKKNYKVEGEVSAVSSYTYDLAYGQTAELSSSDQDVNFLSENGVVVVTTDYLKYEDAFGEEALGDTKAYTLNIDVSDFELEAIEGDLTIALVHEGVEIVSVTTNLNVDNPETISSTGDLPEEVVEEVIETSENETIGETTNETIVEEILNETIINETITNQTVENETIIEVFEESIEDYVLSEEEKFLLQAKTGSNQVSVTKAEVVNDRLIVRFEIGDYWLESSYNYDGDISSIEDQISLDRAKWVKRVVKSIQEGDTKSSPVTSLLGSTNV